MLIFILGILICRSFVKVSVHFDYFCLVGEKLRGKCKEIGILCFETSRIELFGLIKYI